MKLQLLTAVLITGCVFPTYGQQAYGESFDIDNPAVGGYTAGSINGQQGWVTSGSQDQVISGCTVSEDIPSSLTSQWGFSSPSALKIEADPNFTASASGTTFRCIGPLLFNSPVITQSGTFVTMVLIDRDEDPQTSGATYSITMFDGQEKSSEIRFMPDGTITVLDIIDGTPVHALTGATWADQEWQQLTINYDYLQNTISYNINGTSIYEGNTLEGVQLQRIVISHDNNKGSKGYFDDILAFADEALGTAGFEKSKIMVFPNPGNEIITINTQNNSLIQAIEIYDINARLVMSSQLQGALNPTIDISGLSKGVYLLDVQSDNGRIRTKLIKN